jgi:hypothetical protein
MSDSHRSQRKPAKESTRASCRLGPYGMGAEVRVAVLDLSVESIRLTARAAMEPGQEVEVTLESIGLLRPVTQTANVAVCTPADDGAYCVCLTFEKAIGYREFMALTSV